jgi:hypothetical protein
VTFRAKSRILANEGTEFFMPDFAGALGASKAASALLVLFIPSNDRRNKAIDLEEAPTPQQPKGKKRR